MNFYLEYTLISLNLSLFSLIKNCINYFLRAKLYKGQENAFLFGIYPHYP